MPAPERHEPPRYSLCAKSGSAVPDGSASALDAALEEDFHYAYARRLGPLAPLRLCVVDPASEPDGEYLRARSREGQRPGEIERPRLHLFASVCSSNRERKGARSKNCSSTSHGAIPVPSGEVARRRSLRSDKERSS